MNNNRKTSSVTPSSFFAPHQAAFFHLPFDAQIEILSYMNLDDVTKTASVNKAWLGMINNPDSLRSYIKNNFGYDLPDNAKNPLEVYKRLLEISKKNPRHDVYALIIKTKADFPPFYYTANDWSQLDYGSLSEATKKLYFEEALNLCNKDLFLWLMKNSIEKEDKLFKLAPADYWIGYAIEMKHGDFAQIILDYALNKTQAFSAVVLSYKGYEGSLELNTLLKQAVKEKEFKLAEIMLDKSILSHPKVSSDVKLDFILQAINGGHLEFARKAILALGPDHLERIDKQQTLSSYDSRIIKKSDLMRAAARQGDVTFLNWMQSLRGSISSEKEEKSDQSLFKFTADDVSAAMQAGHINAALKMINEWNITPDRWAVDALLQKGEQEKAIALMDRWQIEPNVYSAKAAVEGGLTEYAWKLLSTMQVLSKTVGGASYSSGNDSELHQVEYARNPLIEKAINQGGVENLQSILAIPFPRSQYQDEVKQSYDRYEVTYKYFIAGKDKTMPSHKILQLAAGSKKSPLALVTYLTESKSEDGVLPIIPTRNTLYAAVKAGNLDVFEYLLKQFPNAWQEHSPVERWETSEEFSTSLSLANFEADGELDIADDELGDKEKVFIDILKAAAKYRQFNVVQFLLENNQLRLPLKRSDIVEILFLAAEGRHNHTQTSPQAVVQYLLEQAPATYRIEPEQPLIEPLLIGGNDCKKVAAQLCSSCNQIPIQSILQLFNEDEGDAFIPLILQRPTLQSAFIQFVHEHPNVVKRLFERLDFEEDSKKINDLISFLIKNDDECLSILATQFDADARMGVVAGIYSVDKDLLKWMIKNDRLEQLMIGVSDVSRCMFAYKAIVDKEDGLAEAIMAPVLDMPTTNEAGVSDLTFLDMIEKLTSKGLVLPHEKINLVKDSALSNMDESPMKSFLAEQITKYLQKLTIPTEELKSTPPRGLGG